MKHLHAMLLLASMLAGRALLADPPSCFGIQIVDDKTGRGVPLVELKTVSAIRYWTDSAGWVAIDDPALLGHKVFFNVSSPGYEYKTDGFGFHGDGFDIQPGKTAHLRIKRINLAERLYRITGEGIYADSLKLGRSVPIRDPLINAQVTGQDSAHAVVYDGKIHWFWGDTMQQAYPLGHFWTAGATSELPANGGLEPSIGVNLDYFVGNNGFSRPMLKRVNRNPKWLDGVATVPADEKGTPCLVGVASEVADVGKTVARHLVIDNTNADQLDEKLEIAVDAPLYLRGHPFQAATDGTPYLYFGDSFPNMRVRADLAHVMDLATYEGYTPFVVGGKVHGFTPPKLDRNGDGKLIWGWKRGTPPLEPRPQEKLIKSGQMKSDETPFDLHDVVTKKPVRPHRGSVSWNAWRNRWVMIFVEEGGSSSYLGEVWYTEAERIEGPWATARKVVTHERYSFYNPLQHPFFEEQGGQMIYFEGTYTATFSREGDLTPRYDYNQMMYRLDLESMGLGEVAPRPVQGAN